MDGGVVSILELFGTILPSILFHDDSEDTPNPWWKIGKLNVLDLWAYLLIAFYLCAFLVSACYLVWSVGSHIGRNLLLISSSSSSKSISDDPSSFGKTVLGGMEAITKVPQRVRTLMAAKQQSDSRDQSVGTDEDQMGWVNGDDTSNDDDGFDFTLNHNNNMIINNDDNNTHSNNAQSKRMRFMASNQPVRVKPWLHPKPDSAVDVRKHDIIGNDHDYHHPNGNDDGVSSESVTQSIEMDNNNNHNTDPILHRIIEDKQTIINDTHNIGEGRMTSMKNNNNNGDIKMDQDVKNAIDNIDRLLKKFESPRLDHEIVVPSSSVTTTLTKPVISSHAPLIEIPPLNLDGIRNTKNKAMNNKIIPSTMDYSSSELSNQEVTISSLIEDISSPDEGSSASDVSPIAVESDMITNKHSSKKEVSWMKRISEDTNMDLLHLTNHVSQVLDTMITHREEQMHTSDDDEKCAMNDGINTRRSQHLGMPSDLKIRPRSSLPGCFLYTEQQDQETQRLLQKARELIDQCESDRKEQMDLMERMKIKLPNDQDDCYHSSTIVLNDDPDLMDLNQPCIEHAQKLLVSLEQQSSFL